MIGNVNLECRRDLPRIFVLTALHSHRLFLVSCQTSLKSAVSREQGTRETDVVVTVSMPRQ